MYVTLISKSYFLPYINTAINLDIKKKYVHFCLLHFTFASSQSTQRMTIQIAVCTESIILMISSKPARNI